MQLSELKKPTPIQITDEERRLMLDWAEKHGKCVRQRNVHSDTTKDRAGPLPETAYEVTETVEAVAFEYHVREGSRRGR